MRLLQRWQLEYQAEQSLDAEIATAQQYGYTGLLVKVLDGTAWMAQFDPLPDAISSADQVAQQAQKCKDAGLDYFVWCNPLTTDSLDAQAQMFGECIRACSGGFIDAEPYAHFWGPNRQDGLAAYYASQLRALIGQDAFLAFQGDPREQAIQAIKAWEFIQSCSHIAMQHYWSDFYFTPTIGLAISELQRASDLGVRFGRPVIPTLPGNAALDTFPTDLIQGFMGFVDWRIGSTAQDVLALLGGLTMTQNAEPTMPDCSGPLTAIAQMADVNGDVIRAQLTILGAANVPAKKRQAAVQQILAAVDNDTAIREQFVGPRPQATAAAQHDASQFGFFNAFGPTGSMGEGANPH